jgi:hypothetical protein
MTAVYKVDELLDITSVLEIDESITLCQSIDIARHDYSINRDKLLTKALDFMEISIVWDIH